MSDQNPSAATVWPFAGAQSLRRLPPEVAVVKTPHTRQADDLGVRRRPSLRGSARRRIPQVRVAALGVVVDDSLATGGEGRPSSVVTECPSPSSISVCPELLGFFPLASLEAKSAAISRRTDIEDGQGWSVARCPSPQARAAAASSRARMEARMDPGPRPGISAHKRS